MSNHTAVIGQPVEHSISPKIHNFWIKENGIEVGEYKKIPLNKEDVKSFLEKCIAENYKGLNVTVPHKEAAFNACDEVRGFAKQVGVVNTLIDENGKEVSLFSGDTLFLGDVGRPDLAQKSDVTQEDLAGMLFDSLRTKIMTLPDEVIVYPGHGAGSACGKNMSKETIGSIGYEKVHNYALRADMTKKEFIQEVTDGILPPPAYFPENVTLNKLGYNPENDSIDKANIALSVEEFKTKSTQAGVIILDVRSAADFVKGFIPNSIFIGIDGGFAPWVGTIIKQVATPILLVCDKGRLEEVATRLSRVGFDNVLGHLNGGVQVWEQDDLATISSISANTFDEIYQADNMIDIIDVRKETEFKNRHIISAVFNPLSDLENDQLNSTAENFVHCAGGYRSVIACSLLKREGIHNVTNIEGGFGAIKKTDLPLSVEVCPSTL